MSRHVSYDATTKPAQAIGLLIALLTVISEAENRSPFGDITSLLPGDDGELKLQVDTIIKGCAAVAHANELHYRRVGLGEPIGDSAPPDLTKPLLMTLDNTLAYVAHLRRISRAEAPKLQRALLACWHGTASMDENGHVTTCQPPRRGARRRT